jgi:hypothetical protein
LRLIGSLSRNSHESPPFIRRILIRRLRHFLLRKRLDGGIFETTEAPCNRLAVNRNSCPNRPSPTCRLEWIEPAVVSPSHRDLSPTQECVLSSDCACRCRINNWHYNPMQPRAASISFVTVLISFRLRATNFPLARRSWGRPSEDCPSGVNHCAAVPQRSSESGKELAQRAAGLFLLSEIDPIPGR